MRKFSVSIYRNARDNSPSTHEGTWVSLVDALTHPEPGTKDGEAWSPIVYRDNKRAARNALRVCALAYDLDHCDPNDPSSPPPTPPQLTAISALLERTGWAYAIHESYTPGRYRLVLPLSRDISPEEYPHVWEQVASDLQLPADPACRDLARLFYCPRHPEGQSRNACSDGAVFLDPDGLGIKGSEPAKGTNLKILREGVNASKDKEGRALARELLDGTLRLVKGSRDNDLHKAVWTLTMSSNPVITRDALKAVLAPVLASMEGSDEQDWESKALFSYERALANREREEAQVAAARAIIDPQGPETQWKSLLKTKRDKNGNEVLVPHTSNVAIILEHDERIKGIRFNALRRHIEVTEGELKGKAEETLDTTLSNWLHTNWDLNIHRSECGAALIEHAMKHSFDPVGKFLNGLEWDGVPRLDTMLLKYCKAEGNEQFIRRASRKFMISAVARALSPGCQVDTVLVLSGAQGGGKTSFVRILGQGFHVETKIDVHSKDAVMVATSNWLVELSEMSSVKRGDVESVRAFLTNRSDQIRLPYARAVGNYARRCVFIGTTNSDQPLTDRDGNRRYWVISVGTIDTAALEQDVKQLWAEAVHAYKAGEIWHMTQEEALLAANEMSAYTEDDFYGVRILRWLEQCGSKRPQVLTAFEVAQDVLHLDPKESQQSASTIRVALKNLGWEKSFVRRHGSRVWGYKVPQMTDEVLKELRMQKEAEFKSQKEARA